MFESMSKGSYVVGFIISIALVLLTAVFAADIAIRGIYTGTDIVKSILTDINPDRPWNTPEVAEAPQAPVPAKPRAVARPTTPVTQPAPTRIAQAAPAAVYPATPRVSSAKMTYSAFGTYWNGSFVPRDELNRDEIPAIRVMIYNSGNAPTAPWTLQCSFGGNVSQTIGYQAPLGAGERAFAVCDTSPLSYGTHAVTVSYQETGKAAQEISGTISVR